MKIEIDIPKEFEEHFMLDKFEDSLHRLSADAHLIAGNYEQETAIMLIKAFKESKTAYDVDKVVERLERNSQNIELIYPTDQGYDYEDAIGIDINRAKEIVKAGGVNE